MNTTLTNPKAGLTNSNKKSRWFFLMNLMIAIVIISAVFLLKDSAAHYKHGTAFDTAYIASTKTETNPEVLQHGILYTESARAHAYRSILRQSNGTFVVGLLVAVGFLANSIFIYKLTNAQKSSAPVAV